MCVNRQQITKLYNLNYKKNKYRIHPRGKMVKAANQWRSTQWDKDRMVVKKIETFEKHFHRVNTYGTNAFECSSGLGGAWKYKQLFSHSYGNKSFLFYKSVWTWSLRRLESRLWILLGHFSGSWIFDKLCLTDLRILYISNCISTIFL